MTSLITLIAATYASDNIGNQVATETEKTVYGEIKSIRGSEFFAANTAGLKPEMMVEVFCYDYSNQTIVKVDGIRYAVYRTFINKNEKAELYLTIKAGV